MKERFEQAFNDMLTANADGKVRNLLITDGNAEFLDDALYALRSWALKNSVNLVELDERDDSWLSDIQSRELFYTLNQPNTVLMIKNYATVTYMRGDDNTPRNFLRDVVLNRHYGCGNNFEPSDDLPNLRFVVVINDLTEMKWRGDEYMTFSIIHQDNSKRVWTNANFTLVRSKMHPVMSAINKVLFLVSDDETTLCIDVGEAFRGFHRPLRYLTVDDRIEMIHTFIESNLPNFHDHVECLILKTTRHFGGEPFSVDGRRLKKSFPNLGTICCGDDFEIADIDNELCVLDPFELGEIYFNLVQDGDIPLAITFARDLWALNHKWIKFFVNVARDYCRRPEDHSIPDSDSTVHNWTGMDHLFHIYLLGWYHAGDDFFNEEDKIYVTRHKNFDKAFELLPLRIKNCDVAEVADKLYWDLQHVKNDASPDYLALTKVLHEAERIVPGVLDKMREEGLLTEEFGIV